MNRIYRALLLFTVLTAAGADAGAADLPAGGQIIAGSGTISQSGQTMTIRQDTAKMAADWQSFSIGKSHTVNFVQPSAAAIALNRVLGNDVSVIQGALNANGRVFLINPNGVLFTPDARINTGGLVASTLNLKTGDFLAGNYTFKGDSGNAVVNRGDIRAADGGTIALIAAKIINEGTISAERGQILMGAGRKITLDLGGPAKLEIEEGALDTLVEQGGAIRADGGRIYLTAKAAGELATSVINHTGITQAQTLITGEKGEIILIGDMSAGTAKIAGKLNAAAPSAGDGGFIETSAAHVEMADDLEIDAGATRGKGGTWLIDPFDYVIDSTAAGNISGTLNTGTNVTVTTTANNAGFGSSGSGILGDIKVNSAIAKTAGGDATLTLQAENVIDLAAPITSTSGKLGLSLEADSDANGGGVIIASKGVSLNGGDLNFGTGATATIGGSSVLVGGDMYVSGSQQVIFTTGGGNIDLHGELIIANTEGVKFITNNGNAHFYGIINSGNKYEKIVTAPYLWTQAFNEARNGTAGGAAVGDQYLATVTSRLENAVVVYTGGFTTTGLGNGSWLGGRRVTGIGTDNVWRWVAGPESLEDGGKGLAFNNSANSVVPASGAFNNWQSGEPNNCCSGEDRLQIGDPQGRWNDLPDNAGGINQKIYIRETNFDTANLEIDAGTGAVTFDKPIGGLKGINYVAYDASNPKPGGTTTTTTTTIPKQNAVTAAQAASAQKNAGSASSSAPPPSLNPGAQGGSAAAAPGASQNGLTVGTLEIVDISSADSQSGGGENGEASYAGIGSQNEISGYTKVFVVDGGVNMPPGAPTQSAEDQSDNEDKDGQ